MEQMKTMRRDMASYPSIRGAGSARSCWRVMTMILALTGIPAYQLAHAQNVPDAGRALRESVPSPASAAPQSEPAVTLPPAAPSAAKPAAPGVSFVLRRVTFSGNSVFSSESLEALVADNISKTVNFADLEALAQRITEHYRKAGYAFSQTILPQQDVSAGNVEISIIEGRLGKLRVDVAPEAPISESRLKGILSRLQPGKPLSRRDIERTMLLLADVPGITAQSALEPGSEPGTVDISIEVAPRRRWELTVDADNHGSRATGEFRVGALARLNSPLRQGDNLDLRVLQGSGGGLVFGRLGYELPVGYNGTRASIGVTRLTYDLGKDFAAIDATGQADVYDIALLHPLIRSRAQNLFGKLGFEEKRLEDRIGVVGSVSNKRVHNLNLGLVFEQRDALLGGGYNSASGTLTLGDLDIRSPEDLAADQSPFGRHTNGSFTRMNYQLSRLNGLTGRADIFVGLTGQFANKNLDSAEKIALGGPRAVRAYPVSEGIVDEGHVLNAEYRYSVLPELTVSGFYDWGWGWSNRNPLPNEPDNKVSLRGYGLGLFWGAPQGLVLRGSLAWRDSGPPRSDGRDRIPRVFVQVSKSF